MITRLIRFTLITGIIGLIVGVTAYFGTKTYVTRLATQKAQDIIASLPASDQPDDFVTNATRYVFEHFQSQYPKNFLALKIRPYVTNKRLPEILRFPDGAIETLVQKGLCDNASRMLAFLLKQKGYTGIQWNIVTGNNAHSVFLVSLPDGRKVMADPFFGYVAYNKDNGKLASPEFAQEQMRQGAPMQDVFSALSKQAKPEFYKDFSNAFMAAQGENLTITATLPTIEDTPLMLGKIDGDSEDVKGAAKIHGMTPFWNYAGHKYNREWVRVLSAPQDVRLEMTLVAPVENGILTATPPPKVDGKKMIWTLKAGDKITFRDGLAKISLKRLNSYIGVDQIALYPIAPR